MERGLIKLMKMFRKMKFISFLLLLSFIIMIVAPGDVIATQQTVNLGTTSKFAVLAGTEITNTGPTVINGDVGLFPGTAFTKANAQVNGQIYINDEIAKQAKIDLDTAYADATSRTMDTTISAALGGDTSLTPGVYKSESSIQVDGILTLDALGDPNAVFVFQAGSTLTTASGSEIKLINGARACRVFWQVGSSATLGTSSQFVGNILAMESITATTGVKVQGQLLAITGNVTLDSNMITNVNCVDIPVVSTMKVAKTGTYEDTNKDEIINIGDKINYKITVKNTGNTTLTNIIVKDEMLNLEINVDKIKVGETWTSEKSYEITEEDIKKGSVLNTVTVKSKEVTATVEELTKLEQTTEEETSKLVVKKSANRKNFSVVGEEITYTYVVSNKGNVTLKGPFTLVDDKIETIDMTSAPDTLAPGASFTTEAKYLVTQADIDAGLVTNLVNVTGSFEDKVVEATDTVTVVGKEIEPIEPVEPVEPIEPEPKVPEEPEIPKTPELPELPETPKTPKLPITPEPKPELESLIPLTPLTPSTPIESETPLIPVTPIEPVTPATPAIPATPATPVINTTVTGGQLPETSTNEYKLFIIGGSLILLAAIVWRSRKAYE